MSEQRLAIVGGGRWARVLAGVAHRALPEVSLSLHSPSNSQGMREWVKAQGWEDEVSVHDRWPRESGLGPFTGAVIANRAREHSAAVLDAFTCCRSVLVEKPMAMSSSEVRALMKAAEDSGVLLCAAHVLSFASYLANFISSLPTGKPVRSMELIWMDPLGDERYGEKKSYDVTMSSSHDVMPHVVSVLDPFLSEPLELVWSKPERGGARTLITLRSGSTEIRLHLEREAPERRRSLLLDYGDEAHQLRFSPEPGTIHAAGRPAINADPQWSHSPSPLTRLLTEFWCACGQGRHTDPRLTPRLALVAAGLAEAVTRDCHGQLQAWLAGSSLDDRERAYATRELRAYG